MVSRLKTTYPNTAKNLWKGTTLSFLPCSFSMISSPQSERLLFILFVSCWFIYPRLNSGIRISVASNHELVSLGGGHRSPKGRHQAYIGRELSPRGPDRDRLIGPQIARLT